MDPVDIRLEAPFTAMVVGPTGSGKTRMILNLIDKANSLATPPPEEIIYCYGEWQSVFDKAPQSVIFHKGLIDVKEDIPSDGKQRWLIIDDLMEEVAGSAESNALFTKVSHHRNVSVFFIIQYLFKKENRLASLNTHYFFFFKNPRDAQSVGNLARQAFPGRAKFVAEVFADCTRDPHTFMLMDLRQTTSENARLIGNFGSADVPMYVYAPKI
jgi:hypothetical protein